ncbi:mCG1050921 [Mus musculus]|nr:mCG1050921 [Mus musculus]
MSCSLMGREAIGPQAEGFQVLTGWRRGRAVPAVEQP